MDIKLENGGMYHAMNNDIPFVYRIVGIRKCECASDSYLIEVLSGKFGEHPLNFHYGSTIHRSSIPFRDSNDTGGFEIDDIVLYNDNEGEWIVKSLENFPTIMIENREGSVGYSVNYTHLRLVRRPYFYTNSGSAVRGQPISNESDQASSRKVEGEFSREVLASHFIGCLIGTKNHHPAEYEDIVSRGFKLADLFIEKRKG